METCKNCLHYDICIFHVTANENEKCIHYTPTADVVPKSEVLEMQKEQLGRLKEIKSEIERVTVEYEAMRGAANSYKMHYEQAKAEVAREIFEEIEKNIYWIESIYQKIPCLPNGYIAELKKKYTGV